jgi:hypothetical protein
MRKMSDDASRSYLVWHTYMNISIKSVQTSTEKLLLSSIQLLIFEHKIHTQNNFSARATLLSTHTHPHTHTHKPSKVHNFKWLEKLWKTQLNFSLYSNYMEQAVLLPTDVLSNISSKCKVYKSIPALWSLLLSSSASIRYYQIPRLCI